MKRIEFKELNIHNFLSIGEDDVNIKFKNGINFITGVNLDKIGRKNGTGKSSIKRAFFWCLFGEDIYDNIKNEHLINNINNKKVIVTLKFEVIENNIVSKYEIIRTLKPSSCTLKLNDSSITPNTISLTNKKICEIIQATPEMFKNCIIMSLNDTTPFMAKGEVEKRKFIEQIFNLDFFNNMLLSIRKDFNEHKPIVDKTQAKLLESEKNLENLNKSKLEFDKTIKLNKDKLIQNKNNLEKELLTYNNTNYDNKLKNIKKQLDRVIKERDDLINVLNTIKSDNLKYEEQIKLLDDEISNNKKEINKIENEITQLQSENNIFNKQIDNFNKIASKDKCPICLSDLSDKNNLINHINNIQNEIDKNNKKILLLNNNKQIYIDNNDDLTNNKNNIKLSIKNLLSYQSLIDKKNIEFNTLTNDKQITEFQINSIATSVDKIQKQIKEIENDIVNLNDNNPYIKDIDNLNKTIENYKIEYKENNKKLSILNMAKFVISEEGVKSLIIKKILDIFNSKILYYLDKMQSNCICKFDELFKEEITNEKGVPCSYYSFSGAEKKAIDLACLFSFMDMRLLLANVSYNIVIYDELIDSSFDERGVEIVLNIIKDRVEKYKEATYIISHRKESLNLITGDIIILEKKDGITRKRKNNHV